MKKITAKNELTKKSVDQDLLLWQLLKELREIDLDIESAINKDD